LGRRVSMKWDDRREKREDVCGMRHVLRRCSAEINARVTLHSAKKSDSTLSRPSHVHPYALTISLCGIADQQASAHLAL
jgi:hypothetical protein